MNFELPYSDTLKCWAHNFQSEMPTLSLQRIQGTILVHHGWLRFVTGRNAGETETQLEQVILPSKHTGAQVLRIGSFWLLRGQTDVKPETVYSFLQPNMKFLVNNKNYWQFFGTSGLSSLGSNVWHQKTKQRLLTRPIIFAVRGEMGNWNDLVCMWREELAALCQAKHLLLLQHPRHGDVLLLLTPDTKEVKSLWSQLRHLGSRQKLKESLTGLWHIPILATYSLLLSSQQRRFHAIIPEEGSHFIITYLLHLLSDGHLARKTGLFKIARQ